MTTNDSLSTRQRRFLAALATSPSVKAAAQMAGIAERTAWRYLSDDAIRRELAGQHDALLADTSRRMAGAMTEALNVVLGILRDVKTPPSVRVSAGRVILDSGLRLAELVTLAERVAALEARAASSELLNMQQGGYSPQLDAMLAKVYGEKEADNEPAKPR